ncbi:MAG: molybdenum ABC transporter ATP-binding protein [bacterium]
MLAASIRKQIEDFEIDLALEVAPGFTALFGPSGSGKTTTLNLLAGLLTPDQGEIVLNGRILYSKKKKINLVPQQRQVGYIFQESRLFPHLSVRDNLRFGLKRTPRQNQKFGFENVIQIAGVGHLLQRMPADLSGGEKQRVALARALLASPDYLLMDEPLTALDLSSRLAFLKFLKELHQRLALPILYVTHDLSTVLNFADQVVVLKNGSNVGYGSPYSLLDKMAAPPLLSFEDVPNIFEVEITSHHETKGLTIAAVEELTFILPLLKCAVGEKISLNIPASEIIIAKEKPKLLSASNIFAGQITQLYHLGERVLVKIDAGQSFTAEIVPATVERLTLQVGGEVYLIIKASSFRRLVSS